MQAQPQFTPSQILEAGQRAAAEGRTDYARQFFQHLIDHYRDTPEAAAARNELMNLSATRAAPPLAANAPDLRVARPAVPPPIEPPPRSPDARRRDDRRPDDRSNEPGRTQPSWPANVPRGHRHEPAFDRPPPSREADRPAALDRPQPPERPLVPEPARSPAPRGLAPAPEKNYIAGRVFSGLLAFAGIIGLPFGLVMLYGVFADPALFGAIGITSFTDALALSVTVFLGSIALILVSQIARAIFDAADAAGDLARLERYRMGLGEDE